MFFLKIKPSNYFVYQTVSNLTKKSWRFPGTNTSLNFKNRSGAQSEPAKHRNSIKMF